MVGDALLPWKFGDLRRQARGLGEIKSIDQDGNDCPPVREGFSLCFAGQSLDEFFVTTAGGIPGSNTADGSLHRWSAGVNGVPEFRSQIMIR